MIYHFNMTDKEKFINICDLTTKLVGLHQGALSEKTRKQEYQTPRMVASIIAILEKEIHYKVIAEVLNRDRSLIYHYEKNHKHNYSTFPQYRDVFNLVYNSYKEIEITKKIFKTREDLMNCLKLAGIKSVVKPQVKVKIKSGDALFTLNTNYFDFTNNINIINESLKDYDYQTNIITI
tara:strand:- start:423 stop:956 length:534 start_codon:yes stop_codon:yes gene_type:complete